MPMMRSYVLMRAPSLAGDEDAIRWYTSYFARGASPGAAIALQAMNGEIDVRGVLPTIGVPTLLLYRADEYLREATRFMGELIPGARVVALPGVDHLPWEGDQDAVLDEVERFLATVGDDEGPDHIVTTVLTMRTAVTAPPSGGLPQPAAALSRRRDQRHERALRRAGARRPLRAGDRRPDGGRGGRRAAHGRMRRQGRARPPERPSTAANASHALPLPGRSSSRRRFETSSAAPASRSRPATTGRCSPLPEVREARPTTSPRSAACSRLQRGVRGRDPGPEVIARRIGALIEAGTRRCWWSATGRTGLP